jgi:hypothetical protein
MSELSSDAYINEVKHNNQQQETKPGQRIGTEHTNELFQWYEENKTASVLILILLQF